MPAEVRAGKPQIDLSRYELSLDGRRLKLEHQPMELLIFFVERKGQLVTREDIVRKLWGNSVFVDADQGINAAVRKIRAALKDDPSQPKYLETVVSKGYRFVGDIEVVETSAGKQEQGIDQRSLREVVFSMAPSLRWTMMAASVGLLGLFLTGAWYWARGSRVRWARNQALPEIARLIDQDRSDEAFRLVLRAQRYIPNDPVLGRLLRSFTTTVSIQTSPAGADIYVKTYSAVDKAWTFLGRSPLGNILVPWDYLRWRVEKTGFETVYAAPFVLSNINLNFTLDRTGTRPHGMVRVPGGTFQFRSARPVELEDYWLDQYEVTNNQFKKFVDHGGYENRAHWKNEFVRNRRLIRWEEAMAEFRDSTGRVGPSTWQFGAYPDGQADFPVGGVSWYEAAAYCESEEKSLPTVYHWYKAAGLSVPSDILQLSNFAGKGPAPTGSYQGLGPYGTYDMAGNVKEWTWNETGIKRYVLGGAWDESSYMFATEDARLPFDRSRNFGFRCAKYSRPPDASLTRSIDTLGRDFTREKPVPDSAFNFYKALYSYDHTDLDPRLESVDASAESWRREKVGFKAAYGNERITAYLFLPRNTPPPYATVIYFPGVDSFFEKTSKNLDLVWLEFAVRSGMAVLQPIYMGTYERRITSAPVRQKPEEVVQPGSACLPVGPKAGRDLVTQWAKDLGRSIDYLETRKDIDSRRLAYYGLSLGAVWGPVLTAVEPRLKASVLVSGGLPFEKLPSEIEPLNFAPRVTIPTLMLNGREDFIYPVTSSQDPLFRLLGTPSSAKRHVIFESGHLPPWEPVIKESVAWLDRYLGPGADN